MTYRELMNLLKTLSYEQLQMDVSIYDIGNDEFYSMNGFHFTGDTCDVLDPEHPYLSF